jgi:sec-independent protein translocase protein TatA
MPFQLGLPEVILVLLVALLFLGPKRLPEAGRSLGRGIREFKDGITGHEDSPGANTDSSASRAAALNPPQPTYTPPQSYKPPPAYVPHADQSPPPGE